MEGPAYLQGDHPAGARLPGQLPGLLHRRGIPGDDQLSGAVVVGDLGHAQPGGGVTGGLELFPLQMEHRGHAAGAPGNSLRHGLAPEGRQLDGGLGVEYAGGGERGILPQAQPGGHGGADARLIEQPRHTSGKGHHAGLGVAGIGEPLLRPLKAELFQVKVHGRGANTSRNRGNCS